MWVSPLSLSPHFPLITTYLVSFVNCTLPTIITNYVYKYEAVSLFVPSKHYVTTPAIVVLYASGEIHRRSQLSINGNYERDREIILFCNLRTLRCPGNLVRGATTYFDVFSRVVNRKRSVVLRRKITITIRFTFPLK